jgi:hypothetical protein
MMENSNKCENNNNRIRESQMSNDSERDEPIKLDSYHWHEVLHMSLFLANSVSHELIDHPVIQANQELLTLSQEAHQNLFDLYQKNRIAFN